MERLTWQEAFLSCHILLIPSVKLSVLLILTWQWAAACIFLYGWICNMHSSPNLCTLTMIHYCVNDLPRFWGTVLHSPDGTFLCLYLQTSIRNCPVCKVRVLIWTIYVPLMVSLWRFSKPMFRVLICIKSSWRPDGWFFCKAYQLQPQSYSQLSPQYDTIWTPRGDCHH